MSKIAWQQVLPFNGFNMCLRLLSKIENRYGQIEFMENSFAFSSEDNIMVNVMLKIESERATPMIEIEAISFTKSFSEPLIAKDILLIEPLIYSIAYVDDLLLARVEHTIEALREYLKQHKQEETYENVDRGYEEDDEDEEDD